MQLRDFNQLDRDEAVRLMNNCNASDDWVERMVEARPFSNVQALLDHAARTWTDLREEDFLQAFDGHPKIGDPDSLKARYAATHTLAKNEQSGVDKAPDVVVKDLATQNQAYLDKFGFLFIVCATGKSAEEMLCLLEQRLPNSRQQELLNAASEQLKITAIRLTKLFG